MDKFSVLISVYHKEKPEYLNQCFESIWTEQTLKPNEIVLVQDGPLTEELEKVILKWLNIIKGPLKIVKLKKNSGLATALNFGLNFCTNDLVARMDSDDISFPDRFEKQVSYMINNPDIAASSAQIEEWDDQFKQQFGIRTLPTTPFKCKKLSKSRSPINHPCAIFRKNIIQGLGGYPLIYPEDYALWGLLLSKNHKISNLPDKLLKMRVGQAINERRGLKFLKGEIRVFDFFLKIGFINRTQYLKNIFSRILLRLSPSKLKIFIYKYFR